MNLHMHTYSHARACTHSHARARMHTYSCTHTHTHTKVNVTSNCHQCQCTMFSRTSQTAYLLAFCHNECNSLLPKSTIISVRVSQPPPCLLQPSRYSVSRLLHTRFLYPNNSVLHKLTQLSQLLLNAVSQTFSLTANTKTGNVKGQNVFQKYTYFVKL